MATPIYSTEEDNDEYDLTELERDELLRKLTEICDIIAGKDSLDRYTHEQLIEMLRAKGQMAQGWFNSTTSSYLAMSEDLCPCLHKKSMTS